VIAINLAPMKVCGKCGGRDLVRRFHGNACGGCRNAYRRQRWSASPTVREKDAAKHRRMLAEVRADPVRREEYLARYRDYAAAFRARHPDKSKETVRKWRERFPLRHLLASARYGAQRRGLEFSLAEGDIELPEVCPVLGIRLRRNNGGRGPCGDSPTLDRVDNSKGYVPGNVRVISWRANRIKNDSTLDELRKLVAYLEKL
jgi:hypothetical protein